MTVATEELVGLLRNEVASELARHTSATRIESGQAFGRDDQVVLARRLLNKALEREAGARVSRGETPLSEDEEQRISEAVFHRLFEMGRLQPLLDDDRILNIDTVGHDRVFLELADGTREMGPPIASSDAELIELLREIGRRHGLSEREFNQSRPKLNLQLPDGSRLHAIAWLCPRPSVSIRRHRFMKLTLDDLVGLGSIDRGLREFFAAAVRARKEILVAGPTGAGKTTMLRALGSEIDPDERIITIETDSELGFDRFPELHPNCVALECREDNVEGVGRVTASDLVRDALRMNPDRIIVGEVRGAEVIDMLKAMSHGNDGSMCTIHADSSATVFNKLGLYAMQSPERLPMEVTNELAAAALDLVVYINKTRTGRFVGSVRQVLHADGLQVVTNEIFKPGADGRAIPGTPLPVDLAEELEAHGYDPQLHRQRNGWWQ